MRFLAVVTCLFFLFNQSTSYAQTKVTSPALGDHSYINIGRCHQPNEDARNLYEYYPGWGDIDFNGKLDISDAIALGDYLFNGRLIPCPPLGDFNADNKTNVTDVRAIPAYLFNGEKPSIIRGYFSTPSCAHIYSCSTPTSDRGLWVCPHNVQQHFRTDTKGIVHLDNFKNHCVRASSLLSTLNGEW